MFNVNVIYNGIVVNVLVKLWMVLVVSVIDFDIIMIIIWMSVVNLRINKLILIVWIFVVVDFRVLLMLLVVLWECGVKIFLIIVGIFCE